tara:strand:+ start:971 stop:1219 length:249 start_codon:yes stop_codon:yes gene_type:complete
MNGYAGIITNTDIDKYSIRIERLATGKCENVPLKAILHTFTEHEVINGFLGVSKDFYYMLTTSSGHDVPNWKYALKALLKIA